MKKRLLTLLLAAGVMLAAALTSFSIPAEAQTQTVYVKLPSGEVVPVTVDVPPGSSINDVQLPGTPVPPPTSTQVAIGLAPLRGDPAAGGRAGPPGYRELRA